MPEKNEGRRFENCTGSTTVGFTRSTDFDFHMNIMVRKTAKDGFLVDENCSTAAYLAFRKDNAPEEDAACLK